MASKRAGAVTVTFTAGTAQFVKDTETAKAKVRDFAEHTKRAHGEAAAHIISEHKAASAAMKLFEGNFTNNRRAADSFLLTMRGFGPVLQAAFPVIGALAFVGIVTEVANKVHEFIKNMREAPEKISGTFRELVG